MKRRTLTLVSLIFVMLISCFGLFACAHKHEFSKQDASAQYLASEATCLEKAKYYYSCECGEKGTETFEYGELAGHEHTVLKSNETEHWYECICGDKGASEAHKGGTATCTAKAACEVCNTAYGELLPHAYTELKSNETEHWYECVCGDKATAEAHTGGTATCTAKAACEVCNTAYGELLPHENDELKYNETEHWYECVCGDKKDVEGHKGGTATCTVKAVCEVCEQSYGAFAPHVHDELKYNETEHWNECECGDKINATAHVYTIFKEEGGQKWYECACGAIDSRYLIDVDEEVLISLNSKKLFFNKTALEGAEIIGVIYNGNSILTDGVLDVSAFAINAENPYVLHIETTLNRYSLNNVVAYTEVFEDTKESRELMASIFRGRAEEDGVISGTYALVENLNFDHKAYDENGVVIEGEYSAAEAFNANIGFQKQIDVDEEGKPVYETVRTTFTGIFDGRGYALNNVLMQGVGSQFFGLFGFKAGDGATIKNVAINDVYRWDSKTAISQGKSYDSLLFHSPAASDITITLENVYIYRHLTAGNSNGGVMFYGLGGNTLSKFNMTNVIIIQDNDYEGNKQSSAFYSYDATIGAGSVVNNVYIVTNSSRGNFKLSKADQENSSNYAFYKLEKVDGAYDYTTTLAAKLAEFKAAEKDLAGFDAGYWTVVEDTDGAMPVWNSINVVPVLFDAEGNRIAEINSDGIDEVYTIVAKDANGEEQDVTITSTDKKNITISGNKITITGVGAYKAVITATIGGISVNFNVIVDNRPLVDDNKAVILSKVDGKLYYEDTAEELIINTLSYEGVELVKDGKVDLSLIVDAEGNPVDLGDKGASIKLYASTSVAKCNLNNVKVYAGAFVNTPASRQAFTEEFSGGDKMTTAYSSYCSSKTLTGYYILLEDITFDVSNLPTDNTDAKGYDNTGATHEFFNNTGNSRYNVFKATLDGRGHVINHASILGISSSIFGYAGDGATIKNIAFNHIDVYANTAVKEGGETIFNYYTAGGMGTGAKFFYSVESADVNVTLENVYINDDNASDNKTYGGLMIYTPITISTTEGGVQYNSYSIGKWSWNNVIIINARGPIMTCGNGHAIEGDGVNIAQYGAVTDADSILNTYVVTTASISRNAATLTANSRGENFVKCSALPTDADYTAFSSDYWDIVNGVPTWKTLPVEVGTADELVAAVAKGGKIVLTSDITIENKLSIVADTTIFGAGKTITYTGSDRAIDVANGTSANLTLDSLNIVNSASWSERCVSYNTDGTLTLKNVNISGNINYAVNLPGKSAGATVVIKDSVITTKVIALNIWGSNVDITIENSELYSTGSNEVEQYSAIVFNNDGTTHAENCTLTVVGGKISALYTDGETVARAIRNGANGTAISIGETTEVVGSIDNNATVAIVAYPPSNYFYSFTNLQDAINKCAEDIAKGNSVATVKLVGDLTVEALEIPSAVVVDLNGYSLTVTTVNGEGLTVTGTGTYNGVAQ